MKKIALTTEQMEMISNYVKNEEVTENLSEASINDEYYRQECKVYFYYNGLTFQGKEVGHINENKITLSFLIDIEHKSWGIKGISLYSITGPDELEIEMELFEEEGDDWRELTKSTTIKLNWDDAEIETNTGSNMIGIDHDGLEIELENDSEGNVVVSKISVEAFTI